MPKNIPKLCQNYRQKVRKIAQQIRYNVPKKIFSRNSTSVIAGDVIAYIIGAGVLIAGVVWLFVQAKAKWTESKIKEEIIRKKIKEEIMEEKKAAEKETNKEQEKKTPTSSTLDQPPPQLSTKKSSKTPHSQTIETKDNNANVSTPQQTKHTPQKVKKMPTINKKTENLSGQQKDAGNNISNLNKISNLLKQQPEQFTDDNTETNSRSNTILSKEKINEQQEKQKERNIL